MAIQYEWQEDFLITSADVDFEQKLKFSSLTNFMIQIAWHHAENLSWGVDDLHEHNLVWVLSGLHIELDKYPDWREKISITTWPKGINRLFYLRDYIIKNEQGEVIGRATSNWLMIDIDKRRPKMHQLNDDIIKANEGKHAVEGLIPMLKPEGEAVKNMDLVVRYSDMDLNKHLTTTRYIDWVMDNYTLEELTNARPLVITINFVKEVRYNQKVTMKRSAVNEKQHYLELSDEENNAYFRAKVLF